VSVEQSFSRIVNILQQPAEGQEVLVRGWVRSRRDSKEFSFVNLNDGSCLSGIQVVVDAGLPGFEQNVLAANTGAAIEVRGVLVKSQGKGQSFEIQAKQFLLVGGCDAETYPLQKKQHSFEFLRTISHLRPRTNTIGAVLRVRNAAAFAIHEFFQSRGFLYLQTPIITTADCEGAGAMFHVTSFDLKQIPRVDEKLDGAIDYSKDFFACESHLTVSGQLEAEIVACALGNVYTFGPTFRAENSNTPRHLAEFWMVEPEMAFCDLAGDADIAEAFIKHVIKSVLERCPEDMRFFEERIEKGIIKSLEEVASASFERVTYTEAISILKAAKKKFEFPVEWGTDLQTEHERYLSEEHFKRPVFVTNYPRGIKAFYMRLDDDEKTVSAMDLLVPRIGEIIGGSQREERESVLQVRMQESGLSTEAYSWYLDLRRFGSVPHAGFGLGFERIIMYLTGMANIRDVIPFPRTPGNAGF